MNAIMVANNNGKLPKSYIEKLKKIANLQWTYVDVAFCISAELDDIEEAKFIAMKIIAAFSTELSSMFCSYIKNNETVFFQDRLNGYSEVIKNE